MLLDHRKQTNESAEEEQELNEVSLNKDNHLILINEYMFLFKAFHENFGLLPEIYQI